MNEAERLVNQIEQEGEEITEHYKQGKLKDYMVSVQVKVNDQTFPLSFKFTHETVIEHIDTFSDYVGQNVSEAVEKAIINSIKVQHE